MVNILGKANLQTEWVIKKRRHNQHLLKKIKMSLKALQCTVLYASSIVF